jgi:hypothetical protein
MPSTADSTADQEIASFDDLLRAARDQETPQRLLFVFAGAELPEDSNAEQRHQFESGAGGALVPLMCVDKALDELTSFAALRDEARVSDPNWAIVFVAALSGARGSSLSSKDAEAPLHRMVDAIKSGSHGGYIPFGRDGQPLILDPSASAQDH